MYRHGRNQLKFSGEEMQGCSAGA